SFGNAQVIEHRYYYEEYEAGSVGIQHTSKENLRLYPNPGKGTYFIEMSEETPETILIYDLNGKLLASPELSHRGKQAAFTLNLPAGVYIYRVKAENGILHSGKLMHQ